MARLASAHPRVEKIAVLPDYRLDVLFVDGDHRIYDCSPLLSREPFTLFRTKGLFEAVKIMPGGYGIAWTEAIDLDAYEL